MQERGYLEQFAKVHDQSPKRGESLTLETLTTQHKEMMDAGVDPKKVATVGERIKSVETWLTRSSKELLRILGDMSRQLRELEEKKALDQVSVLQKNIDTLRAVIIEKEQQEAKGLKKAA